MKPDPEETIAHPHPHHSSIWFISSIVVALLLVIIGLLLYQNSLLKNQLSLSPATPAPVASAMPQASSTIPSPVSTPSSNLIIASPSPKPIVRPPLADTSTWQTVALANITFKIPADYVFSPFVSATGYSGNFKQKDAQYGSLGYIAVNQYDGGSRRAWYQKQLGASDQEIDKYTKIQEVQLGSVSALDFFMDRGWWQGGGGSPIIISSGKNIVTITGGRDYRPETGEVTRWIVTDTIASTVLFK